jgi:hypothetical protein
VHTDVSAQDSSADVIAKVFDRSIATLIAMRNQVDPKVFERAAEAIARARKVEFYGVGNSGVVAMDAQHKFFCSACTPLPTTIRIGRYSLRPCSRTRMWSSRSRVPAARET